MNAVRDAVNAGPENTGTNVADPEVDATLLIAVAAAIRDREEIRFAYRDEPDQVEPYRLVSWQRRWYLVARDGRNDTWSNYRLGLDGVAQAQAAAASPQSNCPAVTTRPSCSAHHGIRRLAGARQDRRVRRPAAEVLSRIIPPSASLKPSTSDTCVLVTGADSVETVAVYIGMLGLDFTVTEPPELVAHLATLAKRYARAVKPAT